MKNLISSQIIVVFAVIAAVLAGVPGDRAERNAVYSTYSNLVSPYSYGASPYVSSVYGGVPAISTYSSYPTAYSGFNGGYYGGVVPTVRYF